MDLNLRITRVLLICGLMYRPILKKGSVSGSIYITYLTGVIKVMTVKEGKEIYATTIDRIRGYGLDYNKSSVDAYAKALETLEKDHMSELLNTILQ